MFMAKIRPSNLLERRAAERFGREAGLFVPTGTMGNQIAIRLHTQPGQEVIAEARAHIMDWEMATAAVFSGRLDPRRAGRARHIDLEADRAGDLRARRFSRVHRADRDRKHGQLGRRALHAAGGTAGDMGWRQERKLPTHLDGARIFNAATVLGVDVKELSSGFDTVMFCLSKGLGAPVGSMPLARRSRWHGRASSARPWAAECGRQACWPRRG